MRDERPTPWLSSAAGGAGASAGGSGGGRDGGVGVAVGGRHPYNLGKPMYGNFPK